MYVLLELEMRSKSPDHKLKRLKQQFVHLRPAQMLACGRIGGKLFCELMSKVTFTFLAQMVKRLAVEKQCLIFEQECSQCYTMYEL